MPLKKYYTSTKKFWMLDDIDKKELIYKALRRFESGTTAYTIGRKVGCTPDTARKYLNWLVNKKLVKLWVIGRYKVYAPSEKSKNITIRDYIEQELMWDKGGFPPYYLQTEWND